VLAALSHTLTHTYPHSHSLSHTRISTHLLRRPVAHARAGYSLAPCLSLTHPHTRTPTNTYTCCNVMFLVQMLAAPSLSHTHIHTLTLSHIHIPTHTCCDSLALTHMLATFFLSLLHTHTQTHRPAATACPSRTCWPLSLSLSLTHTQSLSNTLTHKHNPAATACTGWRRCEGCLKLQVIFRKRATIYRAFVRNMIYTDKAFSGSLLQDGKDP